MAFRYRLQKIYDLRERRLRAQEKRVREAADAVEAAQAAENAKRQDITKTQAERLQAHHMQWTLYDKWLRKLDRELDRLIEETHAAKRHLDEEREKLLKAQADLEALNKHRDRAKEEWQEEEKQREMKQLDEVATQRYFRATQAAQLEEIEDAAAEAKRQSFHQQY